jgi:biopolymer transport protein ExbD
MSFKIKHKAIDEADLDITSFMNLMIVLVPVLLLSMTFTQITVHEISLPDLTGADANGGTAQGQLEVIVSSDGFEVYYPENTLIKKIPTLKQAEQGQSLDFRMLSLVMQEVKQQINDKRDILIRLSADVSYQSLVSTMDAVKSYKTVVVANMVEVELFPEISLGDRG